MDRLLKRWKLISLVLGSVLTLLLIIGAYASAGFPVPATADDIAEVKQQVAGLEQFSKGTRTLVLYQDLLRYRTKVNILKAQIQAMPPSPGKLEKINELSIYENLLQQTEQQIDNLKPGVTQ